jgi:hypothetical protein
MDPFGFIFISRRKQDMKTSLSRLIPSIAALLFLIAQFSFQSPAASSKPDLNVCRFAVTDPYGSAGYPLDTLGIGSYLNWGYGSKPDLPSSVEYVRVAFVGDGTDSWKYPNTVVNLPNALVKIRGATWIIGNEPDTTYNNQDNLLPEVYADRYYAMATLIRSQDPTAHIAFATVVQPTPLRIRYLDRVWNELVSKAGSFQAASALVDIWSIHSFILNEKPGSWGTGVPKGFESDFADAFITTNFDDTISISIFKQRIETFRQWMVSKGERNKPLWITEYGSLIPSTPVWWTGYKPITDQQSADFMTATFDYMLTASNPNTGMLDDQNRLVQRWFWYSLNDHTSNFGGSLFDQDNNKQITLVGTKFRDYVPPLQVPSDVKVLPGYSVQPTVYKSNGTRVDYALNVQVGTASSANAPDKAYVSLYEGGVRIAGPVLTNQIGRCGGVQSALLPWPNVTPGSTHTLEIRVSPATRTDTDLSNNQAVFTVPGSALGLPGQQKYLPMLTR